MRAASLVLVVASVVAGREQDGAGLRNGAQDESRVTSWSGLAAAVKDVKREKVIFAEDIVVAETLRLARKVSLASAEGRRQTLDGRGAVQLAVVEKGGDVLVEDTILTNGAGYSGGAVDVKEGGRLELRRCSLVDNAAVVGGAVHVAEQARLVSRESSFVLNRAYYGGAIFVARLATAALTDVQMRDNVAALGAEVVAINSRDDAATAVVGIAEDELTVLNAMPGDLAGLEPPPRASEPFSELRASFENTTTAAEKRRLVATPAPTYGTPMPTAA
eukprot:CAMPEP_0197388008 /NCGR_PEP_ID=MMETSP1165-20131217/828_1 /TAXON_ID=284809 /ORGANISM="Chrysocystis fragilis, Strain CCMP3189" /LENGTH=274 /DNA_ID=CAMNT_0042913345 /DNA_START=60 /DNA_END=884 /DNA_ORIENTATION=+